LVVVVDSKDLTVLLHLLAAVVVVAAVLEGLVLVLFSQGEAQHLFILVGLLKSIMLVEEGVLALLMLVQEMLNLAVAVAVAVVALVVRVILAGVQYLVRVLAVVEVE
jgi:hypothetical protein